MIRFNVPPYCGNELEYIEKAITSKKICGDGQLTKECSKLMETRFDVEKVLMTTSCTHALEMTAILANIEAGDEVIMPSYTFVSTANAFAIRGAKIVFVDIRPDTMNIDEKLIEDAITEKTKAIVVVHYAGVACEMDTIMEIAKQNDLFIIEDAAQGVMSKYKGAYLGTIGDFGCYSFHETKNYSMGEGGALLINAEKYIDRAEIIREKGTNRSQFFRGQIDKYSWMDIGSSYLPSELNVAYLLPQLINADEINSNRLESWNYYYKSLTELSDKGHIELPIIPEHCEHNAHMFYIKVKNLDERSRLLDMLKDGGVNAVFHYVPLHSAPAGLKHASFHGEDKYTTKESERLVRLPLYYNIDKKDIDYVVKMITDFYKK